MSGLNEFEFISRHLAPLAAGYEGAFGLTDDAAVLSAHPEVKVVVTADTLVQGVHFRMEDRLDLVARKALRTNLSDLAAMAARPHGFLLSIVWPSDIQLDQQVRFVDGLAEDVQAFNFPLIGGDTTKGGDRLVVGITAFGEEIVRSVRRNGARPGDYLYVTGTIGDSFLGLKSLESEKGFPSDISLEERYLLPRPRIELAQVLRDHVHACLDISDGLLADAQHMARQSDVQINIELDNLPLSKSARGWIKAQPRIDPHLLELAAGGDDYELLMAVPPDRTDAFLQKARMFDFSVTRIGRCEPGSGLRVFDGDGQLMHVGKSGFTHF